MEINIKNLNTKELSNPTNKESIGWLNDLNEELDLIFRRDFGIGILKMEKNHHLIRINLRLAPIEYISQIENFINELTSPQLKSKIICIDLDYKWKLIIYKSNMPFKNETILYNPWTFKPIVSTGSSIGIVSTIVSNECDEINNRLTLLEFLSLEEHELLKNLFKNLIEQVSSNN